MGLQESFLGGGIGFLIDVEGHLFELRRHIVGEGAEDGLLELIGLGCQIDELKRGHFIFILN